MPAITVGFAELEGRLEGIRRRLNSLSLFDCACAVGAALLLAASLLLASAFASSAAVFTWTLRATSLLLIFTLGLAAWWLRSRWLDLPRTAIFVDRRAALDARLATILAHAKSATASSLRPILLGQVYELGPQWSIERVAPRRLGRSAYALGAALLVFTLTLLLLPDDWPDAPEVLSVQTRPAAAAGDEDGQPADSLLASATGATGMAARNSRTGSAGSQAAGQPGDDRPGESSSSSDEEQGGGDDQDEIAGGDGADDGEQALPKDPSNDSLWGDSRGKEEERQGGKEREGGSSAKGGGGDREGQEKSRTPSTKPDDTKSQPSSDPPPKQMAKVQEQRAGSKAAAKVEGKNSPSGKPLGAKAAPMPDARQADARQTKPMLIKLEAFASKPSMKLEPQGEYPDSSRLGQSDERDEQPIDVGGEQLEDTELVRRQAISPAHRDLIRDLFTPKKP